MFNYVTTAGFLELHAMLVVYHLGAEVMARCNVE